MQSGGDIIRAPSMQQHIAATKIKYVLLFPAMIPLPECLPTHSYQLSMCNPIGQWGGGLNGDGMMFFSLEVLLCLHDKGWEYVA